MWIFVFTSAINDYLHFGIKDSTKPQTLYCWDRLQHIWNETIYNDNSHCHNKSCLLWMACRKCSIAYYLRTRQHPLLQLLHRPSSLLAQDSLLHTTSITKKRLTLYFLRFLNFSRFTQWVSVRLYHTGGFHLIADLNKEDIHPVTLRKNDLEHFLRQQKLNKNA